MSQSSTFDWEWMRVADAVAPQAAVAWGAVARRLLERLVTLTEAEQAPLSVTANEDVLMVIGAEIHLPWVDGVAYAAPSIEAPLLWLPTQMQPQVHCQLLAQSLFRKHGRQPILLWPQPAAVVPLDRQLPLTHALIGRISAHWQPA